MKLAEILDNLKQPIPNHLLSIKEKRSNKTGKVAKIPYLQVWEYYQLLDERCNPENWEIKLEITQTGSLTVAIASLTIHGEDRSITRMATGNEADDLDSWGDPTSNASAQAIRRVCAMFGLSRDLWLKKGKSESLPAQKSNVVSFDGNGKQWYEKGKTDGLNNDCPKYPKVKPYMDGYTAHCPVECHPDFDSDVYNRTMGI